jgi:putative transposase
LTYDTSQLDQWLLNTEGGVGQVDDKSLIPKKHRSASNRSVIVSSTVKTRKIRLFPTPQQRDMLIQWFGTARWTYNQCLTRVQNKECKPTRSGGLREAVVNDTNYTDMNQWVLKTPRDVRAGAYQDLIDAFASNEAKQQKNPEHKYRVAFRSRKDPQERIYIDKRRYRRGVVYPKFGKIPLKSSEPLPERLDHDAQLIRTRLGHYYLCITIDVARDDKQVPSDILRVASIDPGVRTPHTIYDPSGKLFEFGKGDIGLVYRLCHHLDKLQSEICLLPHRIPNDPELKRYNHRKRWRMRKAWQRASLRIRNLIDEYHKQVVHFLVTHYDIVLLPALETSRLVLRNARKLTSKTARAMITWSHYRFRQRLLWKCHSTGCKVVVCGEAYTSKTCGCCGWLHNTLGGSKVFKCGQCGVTMDRDANGARNILLKNASRFGFRVEAALGLTPASLVTGGDARPSVASSFNILK